jgi:hypothetical protein
MSAAPFHSIGDAVRDRAAGALAAQRAIDAAVTTGDRGRITFAYMEVLAAHGAQSGAALSFVTELAKRVAA